MKIKVKKISIPHFNSLIKKMLLMDSSVYINIDENRIWSDVYTPTKDLVKTVSLPVESVIQFETSVKETIKLSFFSGQKLLNCLGYFDPHNITAEIHLFKDDETGFLYAEKIIFKDNQLKIETYCQDASLGFTSMSEKQVKQALNMDNPKFKFTLSSEDFSKVCSLLSLDKNEIIEIYADSSGIHFKSDSFDIIVDDTNKKSKGHFCTFKSAFSKIDKENYEITMGEHKMIWNSLETETNLAINLAITE